MACRDPHFGPRTAQPANAAADAKAPAAANQNAPNQNAQPNQNGVPNQNGGGRQHHHQQQRNDNGWLFWGAYPLVWTPGYTPAFGVYGPGYPFMQQGFSVLPQGTAPAAAAPLDPPRNDPRNDPAPAAAAKPKVRVTSAEWKAKAGRYIGYGDTNFGKQSYLAAVERYRTATQMAPDVAETYFRQAFALVALGQYESAAKTFRRGLRVRSDWSDSPFRLDQIYGDDQIAKTAHVENLAKAVEANPLDAELLLVLGMQIYFDGQPQRAEVFFARVAQLGGNADKLLDDFLPQPGPAGAGKADDAPPAGKKIVF